MTVKLIPLQHPPPQKLLCNWAPKFIIKGKSLKMGCYYRTYRIVYVNKILISFIMWWKSINVRNNDQKHCKTTLIPSLFFIGTAKRYEKEKKALELRLITKYSKWPTYNFDTLLSLVYFLKWNWMMKNNQASLSVCYACAALPLRVSFVYLHITF